MFVAKTNRRSGNLRLSGVVQRRTAGPVRRVRLGAWYDGLLPGWLSPAVSAIAYSPGDSTNDAKVRATGIDPATGKPIMTVTAAGQVGPAYSTSIALGMSKYGIDPNDPNAMAKLVAAIRADEAAQRQRDYQKFLEEANSKAIPWGTIALVGGGLLVGGVVAVKVFK